MVLGLAALAVFVAAPLHAIYRNSHPFNEGRNFYRSSAMELTRQWHKLSDDPLPLISGDDALAFAVAFYSLDHPEYKRAWDPPDTPLPATLKKGWAAICFSDDRGCMAFIDRNTFLIRFVRSEFSVQSSLIGVPGAKRQRLCSCAPKTKRRIPATAPNDRALRCDRTCRKNQRNRSDIFARRLS